MLSTSSIQHIKMSSISPKDYQQFPMEKCKLIFFVNGKKIVDENIEPEWTLLYYLRNKLLLCGTKLGCAEGGCGACTVMMSKFNRKYHTIEHFSVNACLAPICSVHGTAITTVEGIGSTKTKLHPVQQRIALAHGSQCGFCTPGIVMSMYTLLRNKTIPNMDDLEIAFQGNLCRCTGYRPIIEGYKTFCCENGENCCMNGKKDMAEELFDSSEFLPYDPTQEAIFPSELQLNDSYDKQYLLFQSSRMKWFRPTNLSELLEIKGMYPEVKIVNGNTEIGVETKFKNFHYPVLACPSLIPELHILQKTDQGITFGSSTTLSQLQQELLIEIKTQPEPKTRIFATISEMLKLFAGKQIRNVASIGGNIMTASPISDLNPIFLAAGCILSVVSEGGSRIIPMDHKFFVSYRKTALKPDEILLSIFIPYTTKDEYVAAFKQSRRREDDIAIVNAGFKVVFHENSNIIKDVKVAYGGMAPVTIMATRTMKNLVGRAWEDKILPTSYTQIAEDLPLDPGAPGSMIEFRKSLTTSFFFKFYLSVSQQRHRDYPGISNGLVPRRYSSATRQLHKNVLKSSQVFQEVSPGQLPTDPVGRPIVHVSGQKQATGEAVYCDDIPNMKNELYLALVTSRRAHAAILSIDASKALAEEGVEAFFSAQDLTSAQNATGPIAHDEEVFASSKVTCQGQVIGAIVAIDQSTAQRAAKLVEVQYEDIEPIIITLEDAISAESFMNEHTKTFVKGDVDKGFENSDFIVQGEVRTGGQEHFYLETFSTIAIPKEDGEMEVIVSSQGLHKLQMQVASALGVPANRVTCKVKRLGGGFGGKESRTHILAIPCAIAAQRLNRPVRCMLDRDEDMVISGGRHPFLGRYKIGIAKSGHVLSVDVTMYSNVGNSFDLSGGVMERALYHMTNSYNIPNVRGTGILCQTNLSSNTAFRGFGGPQGMFIVETWMQHAAETLQMDPAELRQLNLYSEGDITHYRQLLTHCTIKRCWQDCLRSSDFTRRQQNIENFNRDNRWKKRGIAILPTTFGIAFTVTFLNQGGCLVHVYTDGSVLLTHGGTEMGQGLHTKMIQVASRALGIPISKIYINETSTDKVPNTSPTAASASSDLNGMAVLNACKTIMERLQPFIKANPQATWEQWVSSAYMARVSLSTTGFYKTPDLNINDRPFDYLCYGVAASEVEIDCLTGDHVVNRTDIVMDVGESLNPAIDVGQIEGGFMQGYGLFILEEVKYSPSGFLYTRGPGAYKIPGFGDIPAEFNVTLLKGAPNPRAVYSSKAVGEPPLFLAASVFFAIKNAIQSARQEHNNGSSPTNYFRLDSPLTAERIRLACSDIFTDQFPEAVPGSYKPWSVSP